jgi:hypothetical protein
VKGEKRRVIRTEERRQIKFGGCGGCSLILSHSLLSHLFEHSKALLSRLTENENEKEKRRMKENEKEIEKRRMRRRTRKGE